MLPSTIYSPKAIPDGRTWASDLYVETLSKYYGNMELHLGRLFAYFLASKPVTHLRNNKEPSESH